MLLQVVGAILVVGRGEIVDAHRVVDGFGDVGWRDPLVGRVAGVLVAGAVGLSALNASTGEQVGEAVCPVVPARSRDTA